MPLQNRVTPGGDIIASPARATLMGNRGILHDDNQQIVRSCRNVMWLICLLDFKGRRRPLMSPGTYTELFFLDEAVALAAGHRPCGECRRSQYRSYMAAANAACDNSLEGPRDLDRRLNEARRTPRVTAALADLPDGVFVAVGDDFWLKWKGALHRWTPADYTDAVAVEVAGCEGVEVVTPALSVAALHHGYQPEVHPSVSPASERREKVSMTSLTPELVEEIKHHLRANPVRHGAVFRAMEQGLDVDQMGTSRGNARNFMNSVEAMLSGSVPTTKSAAQINSYGYRYLLCCDLSPELRSYTKAFLRRLREINRDVNVDKPLQIRALPAKASNRKPDREPVTPECPNCFVVHAGECDY